MKFVAPVVLLLVLSGALYKTKEVFSKDGYDWFVSSQIGAMSKEEAQRLGKASAKRVSGYQELGAYERRARQGVSGYTEGSLGDAAYRDAKERERLRRSGDA